MRQSVAHCVSFRLHLRGTLSQAVLARYGDSFQDHARPCEKLSVVSERGNYYLHPSLPCSLRERCRRGENEMKEKAGAVGQTRFRTAVCGICDVRNEKARKKNKSWRDECANKVPRHLFAGYTLCRPMRSISAASPDTGTAIPRCLWLGGPPRARNAAAQICRCGAVFAIVMRPCPIAAGYFLLCTTCWDFFDSQ